MLSPKSWVKSMDFKQGELRENQVFSMLESYVPCQKVSQQQAFLYSALPFMEVAETPEDIYEEESRIRDPKDRPILRAALSCGADLFLTGDKDFLESSVEDPCIISVAEFLSM